MFYDYARIVYNKILRNGAIGREQLWKHVVIKTVEVWVQSGLVMCLVSRELNWY